jgi:hypothetical protein
MPTSGKSASRAVNETLDVRLATEKALGMIRESLADGVVTVGEALRVMRQVERAYIESQEAVDAAIVTEYRQRVAMASLNDEISESHIKEAKELRQSILVVYPTVDEPIQLYGEPLEAA